MWAEVDRWLSERIRPPRRIGGRVLVLCRTRAALSLVRRWVAARGGLHGIDIATPATLAAQVWRPAVLDPDRADPHLDDVALPEGTAAASMIGDRPGLASVARRWARLTRLTRAAGHPGPAPRWLEELAELGWGVDDEEVALRWLLEATAARGSNLGDGAKWDRVVAIGFDVPRGIAEPWEQAVAASLGAALQPPSEAPEPRLGCVEVPDVAAEARFAVRWAVQDPEGALVLVASEGTARRVRDALRRSGLAAAWRDRLPLRTHALAAAVSRCVGWFAPGDEEPWIAVGDLAAVLGQAAFGRDLHPAAEARLDRSLANHGLDRDLARLDRRSVVRVLEDSRLLEAPLPRWIDRMAELGVPRSADESDQRRAARASAVEVRLRLLAATARGEDPGDALRDGVDDLEFDDDDFESIVAELLGDLPAGAPAGGTLGALKAFLVACRVRVHGDPVARAILAALGARAHWPATPAHVHHALSGAVDPGALSDGIEVLAYEDFDGRPCRRVLLLDVHDKGLARRPVRDPLLSDAQIVDIGGAPGSALVAHRFAQAMRAVHAATEVLAVVTRRDADGREVVAPIRLELELVPGQALPSYGIGMPGVPESSRLAGLVRGEGPLPEEPAHPDPVLRHLATQATAEWYREGRGPRLVEAADPLQAHPSLAHMLAREGDAVPSWVAGYLGRAEGVAEAGLPPGPQSATKLLTAASHCLYRAFGEHVLELREVEDVSEDLDPKEIGKAVHDALQRASRQVRWRVPRAGRDLAQARLVHELQRQTRAAFATAAEPLGALSEAREASAQGRLERWNHHWPAFAASRLGNPVDARNPKAFFEQVRHHPAMDRAVATVRRIVPAAGGVGDWLLRRWLAEVAGEPAERFGAMAPSVQLVVYGNRTMPETFLPDLPTVVGHPDLEALRVVVRNLRWRARALMDPIAAVAAEVPFGEDGQDPSPVMGPEGSELGQIAIGPVQVVLGREAVPLRGRIDRIMVIGTQHGPLLEITDYKTGRASAGWAFRRDLLELRDPQLLVYALVLQEVRGREDVPAPLRHARVAAVAWDHVKKTYKEPERRWDLDVPDTWLLVDTEVLDRSRGSLGALLDLGRSGRWPLRPRPDTCPQLQSWGHDRCPFAGACRLRALQPPPEEAP